MTVSLSEDFESFGACCTVSTKLSDLTISVCVESLRRSILIDVVFAASNRRTRDDASANLMIRPRTSVNATVLHLRSLLLQCCLVSSPVLSRHGSTESSFTSFCLVWMLKFRSCGAASFHSVGFGT